MILMRAIPLQGSIPSNGPNDGFAPIQIQAHIKNIYVVNFMYTSWHLRAQKVSIFRAYPFQWSLTWILLPPKGGGGGGLVVQNVFTSYR